MVNDEQDYKAHFTDPDTLVNWDCVQQVVSALLKLQNFTECSARAISVNLEIPQQRLHLHYYVFISDSKYATCQTPSVCLLELTVN